RCYLLVGTDPLLQCETQDKIVLAAKQQHFLDKQQTIIDPQTDWSLLLSYVQEMSLFSEKRLMILQFPENGLNAKYNEKLNQLVALLHSDILLIVIIPKWSKTLEKQPWFTTISEYATLIQCSTPEQQ